MSSARPWLVQLVVAHLFPALIPWEPGLGRWMFQPRHPTHSSVAPPPRTNPFAAQIVVSVAARSARQAARALSVDLCARPSPLPFSASPPPLHTSRKRQSGRVAKRDGSEQEYAARSSMEFSIRETPGPHSRSPSGVARHSQGSEVPRRRHTRPCMHLCTVQYSTVQLREKLPSASVCRCVAETAGRDFGGDLGHTDSPPVGRGNDDDAPCCMAVQCCWDLWSAMACKRLWGLLAW